jgi:hypothetical protein
VWNDELTLAWWEAATLLALAVVTTAVAVAAFFRRVAPRSPVGSADEERIHEPGLGSDDSTDVLTQGLIGTFDLAGSSPAVQAHVRQVLRRSGVVPLDVSPGSPFDPEAHLAVDTEPGGPQQSGNVARQVRTGWSRQGSVLRPAEVVVWTTS